MNKPSNVFSCVGFRLVGCVLEVKLFWLWTQQWYRYCGRNITVI